MMEVFMKADFSSIKPRPETVADGGQNILLSQVGWKNVRVRAVLPSPISLLC